MGEGGGSSGEGGVRGWGRVGEGGVWRV
eukprot:COSAG02_NODE_2694_length_8216_cov_6.379943_1_plen_28_part_10